MSQQLVSRSSAICIRFIALASIQLLGSQVSGAIQEKTGTDSKSDTVIEITVSKTDKDKEVASIDDADRPLIQIALLLDTSNSMDGLIEQAKTQLWSIVNNLVETKKDGKIPRVEVALFEYGNDGLPVTEDYLRQVVPLTSDLDKLSEALFALKTNGGSEYCGAVIDKASKVLNWKAGESAYKAIFIAGNEPFTQGEKDYSVSCSAARASGIIVNTIHCGPESAGTSGKWKHGAEVGGGRFLVIDSDEKVVSIPCPQDDILIKLNIKLNQTYIPYGAQGASGFSRQHQQDKAQEGISKMSLGGRIASKGNSNLYRNSNWDLVDAADAESFDFEKLDKSTLPEALRKLNVDELKSAVAKQKEERLKIQQEIAKVAKERGNFLMEYRKKNAVPAAKNSFGEALKEAAIEQAEQRGFKNER